MWNPQDFNIFDSENVFPTWFNIMGSVCFYSFRTTNGLDQFRWKHKNNFFDTLISFSPTFLGLVLRWQDWEIYFEGLRVKPHSAENFGDKVKLCRCFQQTCNSSRKSRRFKGQQRSNLTPSPKLTITFSACFRVRERETLFQREATFLTSICWQRNQSEMFPRTRT